VRPSAGTVTLTGSAISQTRVQRDSAEKGDRLGAEVLGVGNVAESKPTPSKAKGAAPGGDNTAVRDLRPGYVAHATMAYDELTAEENLILFGKLQGVERTEERAEELLRDVGLIERRNSLVRTYSRGMRQRMAIARALINFPSLFLLDEPATGLDPVGIAWLAETLKRLKSDGCTIVMSLHGESEISGIATRAVRLEGGAVAGDTRVGDSLASIFGFG
jgi:ABC-type multidrug transport system ATPase subunit